MSDHPWSGPSGRSAAAYELRTSAAAYRGDEQGGDVQLRGELHGMSQPERAGVELRLSADCLLDGRALLLALTRQLLLSERVKGSLEFAIEITVSAQTFGQQAGLRFASLTLRLSLLEAGEPSETCEPLTIQLYPPPV